MAKVDEHTGLKDVSYRSVELSGEVVRFEIPEFEEIYRPSQADHPFYQYHNQAFSKERYLYSTLPVHLGEYQLEYDGESVVNVLRCPIKIAGQKGVLLPVELEFLRDFITFCCIYEQSFNERFNDLYAHITVDYKSLKPGESHRVPGFHVDGFQGHKFPEKHEIEHSYLWSSQLGTEFCPQPFLLGHIDDSKYLIFHEMNKQAREENLYQCLDGNVYIFDPYMVHRTPIVKEPIERLLVRITFEYQKLLDPNDTVNQAMRFETPYKYDIRNRLGEYRLPVQPEMYGFKKL